MSLSERRKRELRALADATADALIDLAKHNGTRHEMKPALRNAKLQKRH